MIFYARTAIKFIFLKFYVIYVFHFLKIYDIYSLFIYYLYIYVIFMYVVYTRLNTFHDIYIVLHIIRFWLMKVITIKPVFLQLMAIKQDGESGSGVWNKIGSGSRNDVGSGSGFQNMIGSGFQNFVGSGSVWTSWFKIYIKLFFAIFI